MSEPDSTRKRLMRAYARLSRQATSPTEKHGKLTIIAVAREVGVSHTLVHTKYPDIADRIRCRGLKERLDLAIQDLKKARAGAGLLRKELATASELNRGLASENARLGLLAIQLEEEVAVLRAGATQLRPRSGKGQPR